MQKTQETISKNNSKVESISKTEQVLENGPLYTMFPCSTSKVMDFMVTFHRYDYSISDIAKNSGVTFKTALNAIRKLESDEVIKQTRTVGKAIMYQFNSDSSKAKTIRSLALSVATKEAKNQKD